MSDHIHPDDTTPDINPADDIAEQLHTLAAWATDRLSDEYADRQIALERLVEHLGIVADRASLASLYQDHGRKR